MYAGDRGSSYCRLERPSKPPLGREGRERGVHWLISQRGPQLWVYEMRASIDSEPSSYTSNGLYFVSTLDNTTLRKKTDR